MIFDFEIIKDETYHLLDYAMSCHFVTLVFLLALIVKVNEAGEYLVHRLEDTAYVSSMEQVCRLPIQGLLVDGWDLKEQSSLACLIRACIIATPDRLVVFSLQ